MKPAINKIIKVEELLVTKYNTIKTNLNEVAFNETQLSNVYTSLDNILTLLNSSTGTGTGTVIGPGSTGPGSTGDDLNKVEPDTTGLYGYTITGFDNEELNGFYQRVEERDDVLQDTYNWYFSKYVNANGYELKCKYIRDFGAVGMETTMYAIMKDGAIYAITQFKFPASFIGEDDTLVYPREYAYIEQDTEGLDWLQVYDAEHCSIKLEPSDLIVEQLTQTN